MILDFYHNKIVNDVMSEEFEICFKRELVPLLSAKYGEIDLVQMYEDYIADNLQIGGYWYYPLTLVIGEEIKTQWIRWQLNRTDFDDGLPYAFSGRGKVGFELCDTPYELERRISGRSRYYPGGSVNVRIEVVKGDSYRLSGRYSQTFIDEMARQLTPAIEAATGVTGIADSSVELVMVFASGTYMEHISENVTYRRLMLVDKVSAPRDFWIKWTRLDSAVAYPVSAHVSSENILFEIGEDVEQKVRQREYKYLLHSSGEKYHNSMGRKKVTEWREVIKRAARRGELSKVEPDLELAPETLEIKERIADLLGKSTAEVEVSESSGAAYAGEETPKSDEFVRALEKARMFVEEPDVDEEEELTLSDITEEISFAESEEETLTLTDTESESEDEIIDFEDDGEDEELELELEEEAFEPEEEEADEEPEETVNEAVEGEPDIFDGEDEEEEEIDIFADVDFDEEEPDRAESDDQAADELSDSLPSDEEIGDEEFVIGDSEPDTEAEELEIEIEIEIDDSTVEAESEESEEAPEAEEAEEEIIIEGESEEVITDEEPEELIIESEAEEEFTIADEIESEFVIEELAEEALEAVEPEADEVHEVVEPEVTTDDEVYEAEEEPAKDVEQPEEKDETDSEEVKEVRPAPVSISEPGIAERVADIRAEVETKIRLEYEIRAREKAERELSQLREKLQKLATESQLTIAQLKNENASLRRECDRLAEQIESERFTREADEVRRRIEDNQLREQIEKQLRAEAAERERLAESARIANEEKRRLEEENARISREREEAARAEAERIRLEEEARAEEERRRREEHERELEAARQAEAERIRREQEELQRKAREAMPEIGDGKYTYTTKTVRLVFDKNVDPNITKRIHQLIKATVEYYNKDTVYLKIRAIIPDNHTVLLEFVDIPMEEMPLLRDIILVLGGAGLGINKAIVE